jgi:hypothetical protein
MWHLTQCPGAFHGADATRRGSGHPPGQALGGGETPSRYRSRRSRMNRSSPDLGAGSGQIRWRCPSPPTQADRAFRWLPPAIEATQLPTDSSRHQSPTDSRQPRCPTCSWQHQFPIACRFPRLSFSCRSAHSRLRRWECSPSTDRRQGRSAHLRRPAKPGQAKSGSRQQLSRVSRALPHYTDRPPKD